MSYYPATAWAGPGWVSSHNSPLTGWSRHAPVAIENSLRRYADAGMPRAKLGLGLAFYAICYTGGVSAPGQSVWGGVEIRGGDNDYPLAELFGAAGPYTIASRWWDASARCAYLSLPAPEGHGCRYVSFEDEESIAAKASSVRDGGYGGAIVWTISQGYVRTRPAGNPNFLMQALGKAFLQ